MKTKSVLFEKFGSHWIAVNFYKNKPDISVGLKNLRFCEAVSQAVCSPVLLDCGSTACAGANYAFSWVNEDKGLIEKLQEKRGVNAMIAGKILKQAPRLKAGYKYVGLNTGDAPDIYIAYLMPEDVMRVVKVYQNTTGEAINMDISGVVSVCGNAAAKAHETGRIAFSFGCDDSRQYAQIGKDRLVVAIPRKVFDIFNQ